MTKILDKAHKEQEVEKLQTLLKSVEGIPEGAPERVDAYIATLDKMIAKLEKPSPAGEPWDLSAIKAQPVFVQDDVVTIRPISVDDKDFYVGIRLQYSMICRVIVETEPHKRDKLMQEVCEPEFFYCIIENSERTPIGYLGIKDTRKEIWELAIELDGQYTHRGFGSHSIKLFLNELSKVTGKKEFRATVEVDNIPSQRCFESIGAELVGLCPSGILLTSEDEARFEENNLNLIDDRIRALADRIGVEPRKLLSHILEYRMTCPL